MVRGAWPAVIISDGMVQDPLGYWLDASIQALAVERPLAFPLGEMARKIAQFTVF